PVPLARGIQPSVRRPRRGREAAGRVQPLLVNLFARLGVVTGQRAIVLADVQVLAVDDWRRHVRAALGDAPGDGVAALLVLGQRDVALGPRSDGANVLA